MAGRLVWDQESAGSIPVTLTLGAVFQCYFDRAIALFWNDTLRICCPIIRM